MPKKIFLNNNINNIFMLKILNQIDKYEICIQKFWCD